MKDIKKLYDKFAAQYDTEAAKSGFRAEHKSLETYPKLVELGYQVVEHILADFKKGNRTDNYWVALLEDITKAKPYGYRKINGASPMDIPKATEMWIQWGKDRGF